MELAELRKLIARLDEAAEILDEADVSEWIHEGLLRVVRKNLSGVLTALRSVLGYAEREALARKEVPR